MASPSFEDLFQLGLAELLLRKPVLTAKEGSTVDFLLAAGAAMADKNIQQSQDDLRKTFVDTSNGDELTELAADHFDVQREAATAATVTLTFERTSGGAAGTISTGAEVATVQDAQGEDVRFTTDVDLSFAVGENGPKTVTATCTATGADGNVEASTISRIISTLFDSSFTVTNAAAAAGGNPEEDDESVRRRIRQRPTILRRATKSALAYGAQQVPSVRVSSVTEDTDTGLVVVSVSDDSGSSNLQMINDVLLELEEWRAAGIPVQVDGGTTSAVDLTLSIVLAEGASMAVLQPYIQAAVEAAIDSLSIGQVLYDTLIITAARNVAPEQVLDVTITAMAVGGTAVAVGDYTPESNELLRAGAIDVGEA